MLGFCPRCDDPTLMKPAGGSASCPACGCVDEAAVARPLLVLAGSAGAGKSALFPVLVQRLRGQCLVFDVDWLIAPLKRSPDDRNNDEYWATFRDTWLHVVHAVARNGYPTLLLAPFHRGVLDVLPGRAWISQVHYAVLDCTDDERRARLSSALCTHRISGPLLAIGDRTLRLVRFSRATFAMLCGHSLTADASSK